MLPVPQRLQRLDGAGIPVPGGLPLAPRQFFEGGRGVVRPQPPSELTATSPSPPSAYARLRQVLETLLLVLEGTSKSSRRDVL
eukprot:7063-Heterococcus_DN1.PRE.2